MILNQKKIGESDKQPLLTDSPKPKRTFEITAGWAVTTIVGAVLTGAVSGVFAYSRIAIADHFTTSANAKAIEEIKKDYVRNDVNFLDHKTMSDKIDLILNYFNLQPKK